MKANKTNSQGRNNDSVIRSRKLMNEKEVSEEYGFSLGKLRNARVKGDGIPFIKFGGSVFYRPQDIDAFIESRLMHSTSEY